MPPNDLPTLTTNDVLGIIQRQLAELNAYCSQPPNLVDPNVILAYLERSATFAVRLPAINGRVQTANDGAEARTN